MSQRANTSIILFTYEDRNLQQKSRSEQDGSGNGGQRPSFASLWQLNLRRATPLTIGQGFPIHRPGHPPHPPPSGPMIDRIQHHRSTVHPSATHAPHTPGSTRHTTFARLALAGQRCPGSVDPDRRGTTGGLSSRRAQPDPRQQLIDFRGSIP